MIRQHIIGFVSAFSDLFLDNIGVLFFFFSHFLLLYWQKAKSLFSHCCCEYAISLKETVQKLKDWQHL